MTEAILEPDLPIVDPHHHLWDRARGMLDDPQMPDHSFLDIVRYVPRYLFDELLADLGSGHNIRATIFMECGVMYRADGPENLRCVGETEFVNGIAAMSASGLYGNVRACAGIIGHVDLRLGANAEDVLRSHIAAGHGRFRGIRQIAAYDEPETMGPMAGRATPQIYCNPQFREGFKLLHHLGLSFDAWLFEPQLPDLIDLARAFPETMIVLNHVGTPLGIGPYAGRRAERFGIWRDNIRELAKSSPHVHVKLGGLAMPFCGYEWSYANRPKSSVELAAAWKPYFDVCIDAFGPTRCMFESNFPVDSYTCDYAMLWNALKRCAQDYTAEEKMAMFSGTAKRVYRLEIG